MIELTVIEKEFLSHIEEIVKHSLSEVEVREEILAPLLRLLGYEKKKENIFREIPLSQDWIWLGSQKKKASYHPDYLLQKEKGEFWILEVKNNNVPIDKPEVIAQGFSYANHPDMEIQYFILCNGKEFAIYKMGDKHPKLVFPLSEITYYYPYIKAYLNYETGEFPDEQMKDYGLFCKTQNRNPNTISCFYNRVVDELCLMNHEMIEFHIIEQIDGISYLATIQLPIATLAQSGNLMAYAVIAYFQDMEKQNLSYPIVMRTTDFYFSISFHAVIADMPIEAEKEIFYPFIVTECIDLKKLNH